PDRLAYLFCLHLVDFTGRITCTGRSRNSYGPSAPGRTRCSLAAAKEQTLFTWSEYHVAVNQAEFLEGGQLLFAHRCDPRSVLLFWAPVRGKASISAHGSHADLGLSALQIY